MQIFGVLDYFLLVPIAGLMISMYYIMIVEFFKSKVRSSKSKIYNHHLHEHKNILLFGGLAITTFFASLPYVFKRLVPNAEILLNIASIPTLLAVGSLFVFVLILVKHLREERKEYL